MKNSTSLKRKKSVFKVHSVNSITDHTYVLRFDRNDLEFRPGQYLWVGSAESRETREYSVFSGENEDFLEILVREVEDGRISRKLRKLKAGDDVNVSGPYGYFTFTDEDVATKKFLFVATGTGVSPFHSFIRSYPQLNYELIHGVSYGNERYGKEDYDERYTACVSREEVEGCFHGRVTDYIKNVKIDPDTLCFICGNYQMIHDVFDLLQEKGIGTEQLHAEVYF